MSKFATLLLVIISFSFYHAVAQDTPVVKKKDPAGKVKIRPQLIRGPYLQVATNNSMVLRWRTDAFARSRVRYGTDNGSLTWTADDSALMNH